MHVLWMLVALVWVSSSTAMMRESYQRALSREAEGGCMGERPNARAIPEIGVSHSRGRGVPMGLSGGCLGCPGLGPERAVLSLLGYVAIGH